VNSIACSDESDCVATTFGGASGPTSSDVLVSTDGGQTWVATSPAWQCEN
jgi:hypothetical protein